MKFFVIALTFIISTCLSAQNGSITGKVIDESTGEDLIGAIVQIEGTQLGAATDFSGIYHIKNVSPGTYSLQISYISYQSKKVVGVVVEPGKTVSIDIALGTAPLEETGVVEIVESRVTSTEASVLMEMKEAKGVLSGIGAAQIAKSQDRDASEVARRVPGVTVVDSRFVIVRGLSERYNAVMINNALAPSMETDVKSFSFDIISSGLIDRFLVYKSPSPDLPGEFAGGAIKVFTKNFPSKNFEVTVSQSFGFRSGTTFKDFNFSNRSSTDWLGFDNSDRVLPDGFPTNVRNTTDQNRLNVSRSLPNNIEKNKESAPLDWRTNVTVGKKWSKEIGEFGLIGSINYSRTRTFFTNRTAVYDTYDVIQNVSDTVSHNNDNTYQANARVGGLLNFGFKNKLNKVELKLFASQFGQTEDLFRDGIEVEQGNYVKSNFYNYNQRFITTNQLLGSHEVFAKKGLFEWTLGYSKATSEDPDWRRVRYTKPLDLSNPEYQAYIPFSADPNYFGRLFLNMKEITPMTSMSYEHKLKSMGDDLNGNEQFISLKGGFYVENKQRVFSVRNIGYKAASFATFSNPDLAFTPIESILDTSNVNLTDGIILDEDTKPQDSYTAGNKLGAGFLMLSVPKGRWLLSGGARFESASQTLNTRNLQNKEYNIILDSKVLLPSAMLSYNISKTSLIRMAYGKTINRPEFRELAPFAFYDYKRNAIMNGNPDLTYATVGNYDVRWEVYPSAGEVFTLGAFYKAFVNPIELYFQPGVGSGGTMSFIPGNAPSANNYGVEVDSRIKLGHIVSMINGSEFDPTEGFVNKFTLVANASFIVSKIKLSDEDIETGTNASRPMMGQSPYIINAGLFFQDDAIDLSISAMYNVIGPRVVIAGVPGIPEVWEMPRNLVDLTISKGIGKHFDIRFGVQDMLNQQVLWLQDANDDGKLNRDNDQRLQYFRRGTYFTLGLTYSFKQD